MKDLLGIVIFPFIIPMLVVGLILWQIKVVVAGILEES